MGLGKSFQALYYAWKFLPDDPPGPIVIVCPSSIKINWMREARNHLGIRVEILETRTVDPSYAPTNQNQVYVINYDILFPSKWKARQPLPDDCWASWLAKLKPRLVIGDESQYLKNPTASRTRAFKKMVQHVERVILLSGTPILSCPAELFPQLNILRPDIFDSFFSFAYEYCNPQVKPWGTEYRGAKNLDKLNALLLETCMIRRRKEEVLDQLPDKIRQPVPLEIANRREYTSALTDFLKWLESKSVAAAKKAANAESLTKIGYLKRLAAKLKLPKVIEWIDNFLESTDEKLLIGAVHTEIVDGLMARFGSTAVRVVGGMDKHDKQTSFDKFNRDPRTRLLIGNIQAAGVGWSCNSTSKVAFVEMGWTPGEHVQFEDRVHGLKRGTGATAQIFYLVAESTIEEDLCTILEKKQAVLNSTIDGGKADDSLDVHSQLEEMLSRKGRAPVNSKKTSSMQ